MSRDGFGVVRFVCFVARYWGVWFVRVSFLGVWYGWVVVFVGFGVLWV